MARILPLPAPWWKRLWSSTQLYDALIALGGLAGAIRLFGTGDVLNAVGAAAIFVLTIRKLHLDYLKEQARQATHELQGCLETLLAAINARTDPDFDRGLRATVHVTTKRREEFMQLLDYVGDDRAGKTAGRRFSARYGLAGQVVRTEEAYVASRSTPNIEQYVRELIDLWGYPEEAARQRDPSAMSWMAVPLTDLVTGQMDGMIYLDSTRPDFFNEARLEIIFRAISGIAKFAATRYIV